MEGEDITTNNKEALSIEQGQLRGDQDQEFSLPSAHTIGHGMFNCVSKILGGVR